MKWEDDYINCFNRALNNIKEILLSKEFTSVWLTNILERPHSLQYITNLHSTIISMFGIETLATSKFTYIFYFTLLASLRLIYFIKKEINEKPDYNDVEIHRCITNALHVLLGTPMEANVMADFYTYWMAAKTIQTRWRKCVSDPNHVICKKRLLHEFKEMKVLEI
jgi:hypothetical protein